MKHNGFTRNTINDYHSYRDWTPHVRTRRDSTATRCCTMVRVGTGTIGRRAGAGRKALVRANARRRFAASKIPATLGIANGCGAPAPTLRAPLRFKAPLRVERGVGAGAPQPLAIPRVAGIFDAANRLLAFARTSAFLPAPARRPIVPVPTRTIVQHRVAVLSRLVLTCGVQSRYEW